jgi:hypothetical protein
VFSSSCSSSIGPEIRRDASGSFSPSLDRGASSSSAKKESSCAVCCINFENGEAHTSFRRLRVGRIRSQDSLYRQHAFNISLKRERYNDVPSPTGVLCLSRVRAWAPESRLEAVVVSQDGKNFGQR